MNTKRILTCTLSLLIIISLSSYKKKYRQKIYGSWVEKKMITSPQQKGEPTETAYTDLLLVFNKDGTGYRKQYMNFSYAVAKPDGYIDKEKSTQSDFEYTIPFTFTLKKDDIGNLVIMNYKTATIDSIGKNSIKGTEDIVTSIVELYKNREEKFYWHIVPDSTKDNRKSFQFLEPGTSKIHRFHPTTETYKYTSFIEVVIIP